MDRVLVWGVGHHCDLIINDIMHEVLLGNIEIIAFISRDIPVYHQLDGKPIIKPQQVKDYEYDFIIVASSFYDEIFEEATGKLLIPADVIINGSVFNIPLFNWNRYMQIKAKNISIISESCYGGLIYHKLALQFNTPFINFRIQQNDYLRLLENLDYYISQPITLDSDSLSINDLNKKLISSDVDWGPDGYPIMNLGDIPIHAIHALSFEQCKQEWQRRMDRLNKNNLLIMMMIENDTIAERFHNLPISNKIGLYFKETGYEDIFCLPEFQDVALRAKNNYYFRNYVYRLFSKNLFQTIDLLKLVNGEKDFIRIK